MKRLIVSFESSLLLKIIYIYKCTKHHNYLQLHLDLIATNLQALKLLKHICTNPKLFKLPSLSLDEIKTVNCSGPNEIMSACTDVF